MKKTVSGLMLTLLLTSILTLALDVRTARAEPGTVYVRADGSIDPPAAPISTVDNVTYTLTGNVTSDADGIVVERDGIVIDGNGFTVQGNQSSGTGISLTAISNVTIENTNVENLGYGIRLYVSSNNTISRNNITACNSEGVWIESSSDYNVISENKIAASGLDGIQLDQSSNYNIISGNDVVNNNEGIVISDSSNNTVSGNNVAGNDGEGISLGGSSNNTVSGNNATANQSFGIFIGDSSNNNSIHENSLTSNSRGIWLLLSSNNIISENNVANIGYGVEVDSSSNNAIYNNNFVNNSPQTSTDAVSINAWDAGYPSGGNYWSNSAYADSYSGPHQNETGSDGIADNPYVVDANNQDNFPLTNPWAPPDISVSNLTPSKNVVGQGFDIQIDLTVQNEGNKVEGFNLTALANSTIIQEQYVTLLSNNSVVITVAWNTTGLAFGNYTITAYAQPLPSETNTANNTFTEGWITVSLPGDVTGSNGNPDGTVDMTDILYIIPHFLAEPGQPQWAPNVDINGDGIIDMMDIGIAAAHYLQQIFQPLFSARGTEKTIEADQRTAQVTYPRPSYDISRLGSPFCEFL